MIDPTPHSTSSHETFLLVVYLCIFHSLDQCPLILKLVLGCDCNIYVGCIKTGHMDLIPPQDCGMMYQGFQCSSYTCYYQLIDWLQGNNIKILLLIFVNTCFRSWIIINFKHHQWWWHFGGSKHFLGERSA